MNTKEITEIVLVTPKIANEWLISNMKNRRVSHTSVAKYSSMMKSGEWIDCIGSISFDESGALIDGQHRLLAVVESGVSSKFVVVKNVRKMARLVVDTGKVRTASDAIAISRPDIPTAESHVITGAVKMMIVYQSGHPAWSLKSGLYWSEHTTPLAVSDFLENSKVTEELLLRLGEIREHIGKKATIMPMTDVLFFYTMFSRANQEKALMFMSGLIVGDGLATETTLYNLRFAILDVRCRRTQRKNRDVLEAILHCWNSYQAGRNIKNKGNIWKR